MENLGNGWIGVSYKDDYSGYTRAFEDNTNMLLDVVAGPGGTMNVRPRGWASMSLTERSKLQACLDVLPEKIRSKAERKKAEDAEKRERAAQENAAKPADNMQSQESVVSVDETLSENATDDLERLLDEGSQPGSSDVLAATPNSEDPVSPSAIGKVVLLPELVDARQ